MEKFDGLLISESGFSATPKILRDSEDVTIIETILQEAEKPNRNGRIYSKASLLGAIQSPRIQEQLKMKTLVGESGRCCHLA